MQAQSRGAPAALLLDALGTLVSLESPAPLLRAELATRFGIDVSESEAARAILAEISFYRAHLDQGRDLASVAALRRHCAEVMREALPDGTELAAVDGEALTEALLASLRFRAFAEVPAALADCRARGIRLVVVSNWDVSLHGVLEQLRLAPLLDGILTSAQAGVRKPAPEIFERALEIAGVEATEATLVGDSLAEDVAGARGVGIEPLLVWRDGGLPPAGVRAIRSLSELSQLWP